MRGLANHLTNVSFIKNTADLKCQKSQSHFSATMKSAEFLMNGKIALRYDSPNLAYQFMETSQFLEMHQSELL